MSRKNKFVAIFAVLFLMLLLFSCIFIYMNKRGDRSNPVKQDKPATIIDNDSDKYYLYKPSDKKPEQLEFKLSGTSQYRGLLLTDIEMSTEYKGVIKSGTIRNTGDSDLLISRLYANGQNKKELKQIYRGHFEITGTIINSDGIFQPKILLKKGESRDALFVFDEENGEPTYYGYNTPADQVFLNGIASEIKKTND